MVDSTDCCVVACGGDFTSESGSFTSPGYPNSYPIDTECVWTIMVPPGSRVQLSFRYELAVAVFTKVLQTLQDIRSGKLTIFTRPGTSLPDRKRNVITMPNLNLTVVYYL